MTDTLILLAATDSLLARFAVAAVAIAVGTILILVGRVNVQTRTAEESGRRRLVNRVLGRSNTYEGNKAVVMGYARMVMGVCAIIFGIVFVFVGPFLADQGGSRRRAGGGDRALIVPSQTRPAAPSSDSGVDQTSRPPRMQVLPPLGEPPSALPAVSHPSDRLIRSNLAGSPSGEAFEDAAPDNGMLVGLRIAKGPAFGGVPQAIQPVYQVENRYVAGSWSGDPKGEQFEVLAPAGYAVGAIQVRRGLVVNGVRARFYRVTDHALDPRDALTSEYLGADGGGDELLDARGNMVIGLFGHRDSNLRGLGISFLRAELPTPAQPLPGLAYDAARVQPSMYLGNNSGSEFVDRAPAGGILVGAILVQGTNWGGAVQAIQPIYQVHDRYVRGHMCGRPGATEIQVLAQPGCAVAGLRLRAGLVLNAVQLAFAPLQETRLDTPQMYFSEWIGSAGGNPREFSGEGRAVAGLFGKYEQDLHGLGVFVVDRLEIGDAEMPAAASPRTWTSADGRFSVVATFAEVVEGEVVLRKENGATVRVSLNKLSDADREFIEQQPLK